MGSDTNRKRPKSRKKGHMRQRKVKVQAPSVSPDSSDELEISGIQIIPCTPTKRNHIIDDSNEHHTPAKVRRGNCSEEQVTSPVRSNVCILFQMFFFPIFYTIIEVPR